MVFGGVYAASQSSGRGGSGQQHMIGENGTQITSSTKWTDGRYRIDVENASPGGRPGQMHLQDKLARLGENSALLIYNLSVCELLSITMSFSC